MDAARYTRFTNLVPSQVKSGLRPFFSDKTVAPFLRRQKAWLLPVAVFSVVSPTAARFAILAQRFEESPHVVASLQRFDQCRATTTPSTCCAKRATCLSGTNADPAQTAPSSSASRDPCSPRRHRAHPRFSRCTRHGNGVDEAPWAYSHSIARRAPQASRALHLHEREALCVSAALRSALSSYGKSGR